MPAGGKAQGPRVARFRATILKQGPNPYVDVPERVSRAFAPYVRAGRIAFEGRLNGASIRGRLVPLGRRGHQIGRAHV